MRLYCTALKWFFRGLLQNTKIFATGPFAYSTPVEMIKALSYLMQIVGILYIFCDISRLAAKRPTKFLLSVSVVTEVLFRMLVIVPISQSSHLFQTIEADPSFL